MKIPIAIMAAALTAQADLIDLTKINPGTTVSEAGPLGPLAFSGGAWAKDLSGNPLGFEEATFTSGAAIETQFDAPPPGAFVYSTSLSASFLAPVSEVSFGLASNRGGVFFWKATDGNGAERSGHDGFPDVGPVTKFEFKPFTVTLPNGFWFTELGFGNSDFRVSDAALWVKDISYSTATPGSGSTVPDGGSSAVLLGLALGGLVVLGGTRKR